MRKEEWIMIAIFASMMVISSAYVIIDNDQVQEIDASTAVESAILQGNYCEIGGLTWYFTITEDGAKLVGWEGPKVAIHELYIPGEVWNNDKSESYSVVTIGDGFIGTSENTLTYSPINYIFIPKSVEIIGDYAFRNLHALKTVEFEEESSLRTIGKEAFKSSGYDEKADEKASWPDPPSLKETYYLDFSKKEYYTYKVETPSKSVSYSVIIPDENEYVFEFVRYPGLTADPEVMTSEYYTIESEIIDYDGSKSRRYTITAQLLDDCEYNLCLHNDGYKKGLELKIQYKESDHVGSVADGPFDISKLDDISYFFMVLPDSVVYIGDYAFGGDNALKKITISESSNLEYIGSYSLLNVDDVFIPKNLSYIGFHAFGSSSSVTIDDENLFFSIDEDCNLTTKDGTSLVSYLGSEVDYSLPESVTSVRSYAFTGNDTITSISFKNGIEWGMFPFMDTSISEIKFGDDVSEIPDYIFAGTALVDLKIPNTISEIGTKAFYSIPTLKTVEFEEDSRITVIGPYAFSSNIILKTVTFGSSSPSVSCEIEEGAFYNCKLLTNVYLNEDFNLKTIGKGAFAKDAGFAGFKGTMKAVSFNSSKGIIIPSSVESIGVGAFANMNGSGHDSTGIEPGWRMMNDSASFAGNLNASGFTIKFEDNSKIGSIGDQAFAGLLGVTSIDLRNCICLESIGYQSFRNTFNAAIRPASVVHTGITNISLPESLISIGNQAFQIYGFILIEKYLLESLEIPSSVKEIGTYAFNGSVKKISFQTGSKITDIGTILDDLPNGYSLIDLSNCVDLKTVKITQDTILPPGVYDISGSTSNIIQNENVVLSYTGENKISIDSDDIIINKGLLKGDYTIELEEGNDLFDIVNGLLVMGIGEDLKVIGVNSSQSDFIIDESTGIDSIGDFAFIGSSIGSLRIESNVDVGEFILSGCRGVDLFILSNLSSVSDISFDGSRELSIYLDHDVDASLESIVSSCGIVYRDLSTEDVSVYLPTSIDDISLAVGSVSIKDGNIILDELTFSGGYTLFDLDCRPASDISIIDYDTMEISIVDLNEVIIDIAKKDRDQGPFVQVIFDGDGGFSGNMGWTSAQIPKGMTILDAEIPSFIRGGYEFTDWYDANGTVWHGFDKPLDKDVYLVAGWINRLPTITVDTYAGCVLYDSIPFDKIQLESGTDVKLSIVPYPGYKLLNWVVDGVEIDTKAEDVLKIESIEGDHTISVTYVYSSPSSGLNSIVNTDLPTDDDFYDLVKVSELGGFVDTSSMMWTGHSSVPLVVDDRIYFRSGGYMYVAESDTGFVLKKVKSISQTGFYHYIGYGDGLIIDYATKKVYDQDLNPICTIPSVGTLEYYEGYFYTSGSSVERFSSQACYDANGGTVQMENVGTIDNVYSSYGISRSVFVGDYMYRVYADNTERGIAAMDLTTGQVSYKRMDSLTSRYMDDGWLSYSDGTLYLTGYTQGLFGSVACDGDNVLAFVNVDGLTFGEESSFTLIGEHYFMSEFLVYEDRGFVNSGGTFYVFEIGGSGDVSGTRTVTLKDNSIQTAFSHGSMVMNIGCAGDGSLYFYIIPYQSEAVTMSLIKYSTEDYSGVGIYTSKLPQNYNSQAIRSDVDGRMIWYNDSGHIFTYTTPEKNVYYFFIQDGTSAGWYESYGSTAADALSALGHDVVTLDSTDSLSTVHGKDASCWSLYVLTDVSDKTKSGSIGDYRWIGLDNLYSNTYDTDHYYVITDSTVPAVGTEFTYVDGSSTSQYAFEYNIGDRSVVGKDLVRGSSAVTIRFFYNGDELYDHALIGMKGDSVIGSFPSMFRYGMVAQWSDSKGNVVTVLPQTFDEDETFYMDWVIKPAPYNLNLDVDTTDRTCTMFKIGIERVFGSEDLDDASLYAIAYYSDGRFISTMCKIVIDGGHSDSTVSFSSDSLVDVSFRIVQQTDDLVFDSYGSAYWSSGDEL